MLASKRWKLSVWVILLALALVAAACGSQDGGGGSSTGGGSSSGSGSGGSGGTGESGDSNEAGSAPIEISMALDFGGQDIPKEGNPVQQAIEEFTNTKLDITHYPGNTYQDKLSTMIASGDMPKVVASYGAPKQSFLLSAFQNDVFWDIKPYIDEFPNLSKLNSVIYENVSFQGGIYGLPRERPLARDAYIYRADWVENLGLEEPETIDDYYNMLVAFKENDPDGNGVDDTYGLTTGTLGGSQPSPRAMAVFFGAPNVWDVQDGKFVRDVFTPGYLEGLRFERRLFEEGLMHPDFSIMDRPQIEGEFTTGKAGVIANTTNAAIAYESRIQQTDPNGKVSFFSILSHNGEKRVPSALGSNGILMFPKSSVETEEELKQIMSFFDKLAEQEMADLLSYGLEGVHFEMVDGKPSIIDQEKYDSEVAFPYKWVLRILDIDPIKTPGDVHPLMDLEIEVTQDNQNYLVNNPSNPFVSETLIERGAELEQIIRDANTKFIMGAIDEEEWQSEMDRWWSQGGEKIAQEFEEQWALAQ